MQTHRNRRRRGVDAGREEAGAEKITDGRMAYVQIREAGVMHTRTAWKQSQAVLGMSDEQMAVMLLFVMLRIL